jgi:hypothetical protein
MQQGSSKMMFTANSQIAEQISTGLMTRDSHAHDEVHVPMGAPCIPAAVVLLILPTLASASCKASKHGKTPAINQMKTTPAALNNNRGFAGVAHRLQCV